MAYPPGSASTLGAFEDEVRLMPGKDEAAEIDEIRRYEDFSTVDWIQDSLHERHVRSKPQLDPNSFFAKMNASRGILGWLWRAVGHALEEGQSWVIVTLVGIGIGVTAALMSIMTSWLTDMKLGYCTTGWWLTQKSCCLEISDEGQACAEWRNWGAVQPFMWLAYVLVAALFSFSAAFLVRAFAPYAAGSGISEIKCIIGGFIIKGFLSTWTLAIKALTLPLAIASGLSVGKEGPSVHVACSVGNVIGRMFPKYDRSHTKMRELLTASSAAGVAVAFGSPIGGVLFSIEEMNQTFANKTMWRSFVCALVATFTLSLINPFGTGKLVLFQVSYDRDWHYFEIPAYILIGIFGVRVDPQVIADTQGLYGAFVIKFNLQVAAFRRKHLSQHGVAEAVTLAVITAMIGYLNRFLRIDMTESMEILFKECEGGGDHDGLCQTKEQWPMVNSLLLATIVRTGLIIVSYGCKVPAGIFVPSMAVGATFGRMIGILSKALQAAHPNSSWYASCPPDVPCITPGTYAFLGAAATLGGITQLTVTVVVIMFELTGALTYILPLMIVVLVTKAVSDQFGGGGVADQMIRFNGFPFLEKEDKEDGDHAFIEPIENVMKKDIMVMQSTGTPLAELDEILQSTTFQGFPVVRSATDFTILGFIRKTELRFALDKAKRLRALSPNAMCTFEYIEDARGKADLVFPSVDRRDSRGNPVLGAAADMESRRRSDVEIERVDLGQYVDQTPLSVSPKLPLEIVMQLFRRMGPRVILVSSEGRLVGLVTVKDVLRHEASEHHHKVQGHSRTLSTETANGWHDSWSNAEDGGEIATLDRGHGLEIVLEEAYGWTVATGAWVKGVIDGWSGRRGSHADRQAQALDFELQGQTD